MAGRGSQPELPIAQSQARPNGLTNGNRAASTTSIPQPSPTSAGSGLSKPLSKLKLDNGHTRPTNGGHYNNPGRRHDVEKSATADAHINQLRMEIEARLRISLPDDISAALTDGVILCHIANHVRPRAVPSIHVPSPSVVSLLCYLFTKAHFQSK